MDVPLAHRTHASSMLIILMIYYYYYYYYYAIIIWIITIRSHRGTTRDFWRLWTPSPQVTPSLQDYRAGFSRAPEGPCESGVPLLPHPYGASDSSSFDRVLKYGWKETVCPSPSTALI